MSENKQKLSIPKALANIGDDFDWDMRDYDSFRIAMLEELVARFPERNRWTPADMEVVIIEVLAYALDQLSDMLDRVSAEAYLETARQPQSVRRLLKLIGYDAVSLAMARGHISQYDDDALDQFWLRNPLYMQLARLEGPRQVSQQKRMVTVQDYSDFLHMHPLILNAQARQQWQGSWYVVQVLLQGWQSNSIDALNVTSHYTKDIIEQVSRFHGEHNLPLVTLDGDQAPSIRSIIEPYLEHYRMAGQDVQLLDAQFIPIYMYIIVRIKPHFFQAEIVEEVNKKLSTEEGGLFVPGHLRFGQDLLISDVIEIIINIDGVEDVHINNFKRLGKEFSNQAQDSERISVEKIAVAICDNRRKADGKLDNDYIHRGYYDLVMVGGHTS